MAKRIPGKDTRAKTRLRKIDYNKITFFSDRGCWKKMIDGKLFYMPGDGSKKETEVSKGAAIQQLKVKVAEHEARKQGQINSTNEYFRQLDKKIAGERAKEIQKEIEEDIQKYGGAKNVIDRVNRREGVKYFEKRGIEVKGLKRTTSVKEAIQQYLEAKLSSVKSGEIKIYTFEQCKFILKHVEKLFDELNIKNIDDISAKDLQLFMNKLKQIENLGQGTKHHITRYCKWLLKWCFDMEILENQIRSIDKILTFKKAKNGNTNKDIFTIEQLKFLLSKVGYNFQNKINLQYREQRLYFLLMLNCGFSYEDIANLKKDEIENDYIKRQRTKTGVFSVFYLWKETKQLLKECLSNDPNLALLNKNGIQLITNHLNENGNNIKTNNIELSLKRFLNRKEIQSKFKEWNLKRYYPYMLRKSMATLVKSKKDLATSQLYLAHSSKSVAEESYIEEDFKSLTDVLKEIEAELFSYARRC